ncbi:MAG: ATP-binding cassette domain-containing protein [Saprospiraceae bacterium]|nr:ATP-binding cassette domain-containing protein [Saprospiraceae bacterium]
MVTTHNLSYSYTASEVLKFPDVECHNQEILLILGSSGVGKTTLLHLLGGVLTPQEGTVRIENTELNGLSGNDLDRFRGKNIGIIFQQNHFVASLNVVENLLLAQSLAGNKSDKAFCISLLERLNIAHKVNSSISDLSQGEKQRVSIARALVNRPKLILADEPTSALDDDNCDEVISLLEEQAKLLGSALIIVTHDGRLKDKISNRILLN